MTLCLRSRVTESEPEKKAAPNGRKTSPFRRFFEWFWGGAALNAKLNQLPELGERAATLALRARVNASVARNALRPVEPPEPSRAAVAAELYRQSAYWSLCALSATPSESLGSTYDETAWSALDESLLRRAASGSDRLDSLRTFLSAGSFVYFAELGRAECDLACVELGRLATALLDKLGERAHAFRAAYLRRAFLLGAVGICVLGIARGAVWYADARERSLDLTRGKEWHTSSIFEEESGGCVSPEQYCAGNSGFFFHTDHQKNPWIEFDLGSPQSFSQVRVENRKDCCTERGYPLVIEVSSDRRHWHIVAERTREFSVWRARFPAVEARYVRLRLRRTGYFHLASVRILP